MINMNLNQQITLDCQPSTFRIDRASPSRPALRAWPSSCQLLKYPAEEMRPWHLAPCTILLRSPSTDPSWSWCTGFGSMGRICIESSSILVGQKRHR